VGLLKINPLINGLVLGLLTPLLTLVFIVCFFTDISLKNSLIDLYQTRSINGLISIAAIPNMLLFFVFLKQNRDTIAKGVLAATLLIAMITVLIKSNV
jgi:hypothetical protein